MGTEDTIAKFYKKQGISPKWADCKISDLEGYGEPFDKISSYLNQHEKLFQQGLGLLIYGPSGCGKSHTTYAICRWLLENTKSDTRVIFFDTLISKLIHSWQDAGKRAEFIRTFKSPKVLIIEDLGVEINENRKTTPAVVLETVLKHRLLSGKPTIITSTLYPTDIRGAYGDRIASLFSEYFYPIDMVDMPDFRSMKAKDRPKL